LQLSLSSYSFYLWQIISILLRDILFLFSTPREQKKISYTWWSRLWRIYTYLKRQKRKKKKEEREKKRKKREEEKKKKSFDKRRQRRRLKVIFKSFFRKKKKTPKQLQKKQKEEFLKKWKRRRRNRLFWVYFKSLGKRKTENPQKQLLRLKRQKAKDFEKYRKTRRKQFVIRKQKKILIDFLSGKGLPKSTKRKGPSLWKQILYPQQLTISLNSLLFFLLSYFFISFFEKLGMSITALLFDYKSIIFYYKIEFLVDYDAWYADSVKAIFATGPIIAVLIGILSLIIYSKVYLENGLLKILMFWAIFHGFNKIINGAFIGSMLGQGFGYVIMYMYYSDTGKLIMAILMILFSVIVGSFGAKYWVMSANSYYNFSKTKDRPLFILSQVFLPFLIGNILIYLLTQPETVFYDTMVNAFMLFMILPSLFLSKQYQDYYFDEEPRTIKISYALILFTLLFIGSYRYFLDIGLRIG